MKKILLYGLAFLFSFSLGFAVKSIFTTTNDDTLKKVTGIGGIFFKCKDPQKMTAWYHTHLGLKTNPYGASFDWYEGDDSTKKAQTQWTPFPQNSKYFEPGQQDFMINYRVENLVDLVKQLRSDKVIIVDSVETYDYGKFVHILDMEGNKVQLWEAVE